jgi:hypothetical protein
MGSLADKRTQKRLIVEDSFTVHRGDDPCRVVDISESGLGVTYISEENWPEKITLAYTLDPKKGERKVFKCRTIWESSMDFYKTRSDETVRRRGLIFVDPASGEVKELNRHLMEMAVKAEN